MCIFFFRCKYHEYITLTGGMQYWSVDNTSSSARTEGSPLDVEVAGYALLSLMADRSRMSIIEGSKIVRWLTMQRNVYGGFKSTQVSHISPVMSQEFYLISCLQDFSEQM